MTETVTSVPGEVGVAAQTVQGMQTAPAINAADNVGVLTDALNRRASYTFDTAGRATRLVSPGGGIETWQRNGAGQATRYQDPLQRTTSYTWAGGDLTRIDRPDGGSQQFVLDGKFHRPIQLIGTLGRTTTITIDQATGQPLVIEDPLHRLTTIAWDECQPARVTRPGGAAVGYLYDSQHRLEAIVPAVGGRTTFTRDSLGNVSATPEAQGYMASRVWDAMRRVT